MKCPGCNKNFVSLIDGVCILCESEGVWIDPTGGVHTDEDDQLKCMSNMEKFLNNEPFIIISSVDEKVKTLATYYRLSFTYLHHKLEDDAGHDVYYFYECSLPKRYPDSQVIDDSLVEDGLYQCGYNGKKCTLFFWHDIRKSPHGLVVYDDDQIAVKDAWKKYEEKTGVL